MKLNYIKKNLETESYYLLTVGYQSGILGTYKERDIIKAKNGNKLDSSTDVYYADTNTWAHSINSDTVNMFIESGEDKIIFSK